jgi:hypothetical protein
MDGLPYRLLQYKTMTIGQPYSGLRRRPPEGQHARTGTGPGPGWIGPSQKFGEAPARTDLDVQLNFSLMIPPSIGLRRPLERAYSRLRSTPTYIS